MNQRFIGLAFIMTLWFVISFVTNILGPIMPLVIKDFGLSLALAGFLPFSFFLAYGVVSIPAGLLIERIGAKNALIFALVINLAGAAMFAIMPAFATAVLALFVIGMGMAMLFTYTVPRYVKGRGVCTGPDCPFWVLFCCRTL